MLTCIHRYIWQWLAYWCWHFIISSGNHRLTATNISSVIIYTSISVFYLSSTKHRVYTLLDIIIIVVLLGQKSTAIWWTATCQETQARILAYLVILLVAYKHQQCCCSDKPVPDSSQKSTTHCLQYHVHCQSLISSILMQPFSRWTWISKLTLCLFHERTFRVNWYISHRLDALLIMQPTLSENGKKIY